MIAESYYIMKEVEWYGRECDTKYSCASLEEVLVNNLPVRIGASDCLLVKKEMRVSANGCI